MLVSLLVTMGLSKYTLAFPSKSVFFLYDKKTVGTASFLEGLSLGFAGTVESKKMSESVNCHNGSTVIIVGAPLSEFYINKCGSENIYVADTSFNIKALSKKHEFDFCGIVVNQPTLLQIQSIERHIPGITRLGYLYSNDYEVSDIKKSLHSSGIDVVTVKVPQGENPGNYFRYLMDDVDAILVSDNETIWPKRNIKGYLLASIRQGKNLIGGSGDEYVKAGILAGIYTDMRAYGLSVGASITEKKIHQSNCTISPPPGIFKYNKMLATRMSIEVNNE